MKDYDVLVVGGGAAGLASAVSAAENGARVLLLESEGALGGSMLLAAGVLVAGGTSIQADLGVRDTPEAFFHYYMTLNQWRLQPGLIWTFCQEAAPMIEWLLGIGVRIPIRFSSDARTAGLYKAGVEDTPRGHVPVDGGYAIVEALDRARRSLRVDVALHTRVERLLKEGSRVVGVFADDSEVRADAMVVATGGFGQNIEMVAEHFPAALLAGDALFSVSAPGSRGDHVSFAKQVGAGLVGRGHGLLLTSAYFQRLHYSRAGSPPLSRIYVNQSGQRFIDEDAPYAVSSGIFSDNGGFAWAIFDEVGRQSLDGSNAEWTPERVSAEADAGRTHRASTLEALATTIGVPVAALTHTVQRWNGHIPAGDDPDYRRHITLKEHGYDPRLDPVAAPPFYAVRMVQGELVTTHMGMRIDAAARVLDEIGEVIPGLRAAGEAGGGILGERYVGGGNSIASALTLGRIAGAGAALDSR